MLRMVAGVFVLVTTDGSTLISKMNYRYGMKKATKWESWHARAKEAKAASGARPDVEIAEQVSEILERAGKTPVKRAVVNHWLNGRRDPSLSEFFALCQVIDASPIDVLFGRDETAEVVEMPGVASMGETMAEIRALLENTDTTGRRMVVAMIRSALGEYSGKPSKKGAAA